MPTQSSRHGHDLLSPSAITPISTVGWSAAISQVHLDVYVSNSRGKGEVSCSDIRFGRHSYSMSPHTATSIASALYQDSVSPGELRSGVWTYSASDKRSCPLGPANSPDRTCDGVSPSRYPGDASNFIGATIENINMGIICAISESSFCLNRPT